MSHPLYNPHASGNQNSAKGQYGLPSIQAERDSRRASSRLGPGSSFSSSGVSSTIHDSSGGMPPSLMSPSMNYRPEQSRSIRDADIERSIDMHISRAREEVRVPGKPMHPSIDQDTRFTSRGDFRSTGTGMASNPMSSTPESGSSSLDWSSNYKRPTADGSKFYSSSLSSDYASGTDGRFNAPSGRDRDMRSIPGLGNYDYPVPDKPSAPPESSRPKYTFESASSILLQFGLEKEDLEHLASFPEDQINPDNLPFILRQICIQKTKRATAAEQPKPYPEPQSTRNMSGMDSHSSSSSGGPGMHRGEMSSAVLQQSKVIDYGHTGKYTGGVGDDIVRTSGSRASSSGSGRMLPMDSGRHSREPLQNTTTEVKSRALGSSHEQTSSRTSLKPSYSSILKSVAPPSHDHTKLLQTQPNQTSQTILSSFSLPKKDTDIRVFKSEASRPVPLKEPEADRQSTSKTQPPGSMLHGVHPSRPVKSVPPAALNPSATDASRAMQHPVFIPGDLNPTVIPPVLLQPIPSLMSISPLTLPISNRQLPAKMGISKGVPLPAMMQDYAATSPRVFPHTCTLCNKECSNMKDWITHQNTSLHLENCKFLRTRYPEWDGEIILGTRAADKDVKPLPPTSGQTFQHHGQKTSHGGRSRSHSPSPRRRHGSEGRKEKRSSRSRSPHSSRYTHRSRSRSHSPRYDHSSSSNWSRSRSPEKRSSPRRRGEKRSSPRRNDERRTPPRRSDEKRSSPTKSRERRSSPKKSDGRSGRSEERGSPPKRSHERRSSTERSSPQQKRSNSAERLAKILLETSAVQSRSKQSDLETMVKTLAPALLAELAKMRSSSSSSSKPSSSPPSAGVKRSSSAASSSSSSATKKKESTTKPSKAKPSQEKSEAVSSSKMKSDESSSLTAVKLHGIYSYHAHNDVVAAVEQFGKTKSVVLFRSRLEAVVRFEKEEDAKKLTSAKSLTVKGMTVTVVKEKETDSKEQKKSSQKTPATSSVSTPQTTKSTTSTTEKVPSSTANKSSAAKKAATSKLTSQKVAAKGSVKDVTTVSKAKVLVSKAKNISTKQIAKTLKRGNSPVKGAAKKAAVKPNSSKSSGAKSTGKVSKNKTEASQTQQQAAGTEAAVEAKRPSGKTVKEDPVTAAKAKTTAASAKDSTKAASKVSTDSTESATSVTRAASTSASTKATLNRKNKTSAKAQDDVSDDIASSDAFHFDEQSFNLDDFVTVDEIGDDVEDTKPEPDSSSSSSSRAKRESKSSGGSSGDKKTSTKSSKDTKSSTSSSSSSSKSTKGSSSSNSSSVSTKKSKDSSESTKSLTKPSSSASVSKASSSSCPLPTNTDSQAQSLEGDFNLKDQKKNKEEGKQDDIDKQSKKSGATTTASKSKEKEKSPKKQDRTVQKHETQTKTGTTTGVSETDKDIKETTDEKVCETVDSAEDQTVQDAAATEKSSRRKSARGKKDDKITSNVTEVTENPEEATYKILDSVEDKTTNDGPTITSSTRGKSERTSEKDASNEKRNKEDTPARESQEQNREKTTNKEEKAPPEESTPTKKSDSKRKDEGLTEEEASAEKEGTPTCGTTSVEVSPVGNKEGTSKTDVKKENKSTAKSKSDTATPEEEEKQESPEKNDATSTLNLDEVSEEEEDYPDDPAEEHKLRNKQATTKKKQNAKERESKTTRERGQRSRSSREGGDREETKKSKETTDTKELVTLDEVGADEAGEESTLETRPLRQGDEPVDSLNPETLVVLDEAGNDEEKKQESPVKNDATSTLNLDEVSEEEEHYPDDMAEEEKLRKKKQFAKERESKTTRERGRRSRSSREGGDGEETKKLKETPDTKELVTLDEVGADEAGEESTLETRPLHQGDEPVDSLNPETLVILDEAGNDEEEKPDKEQAEKTSGPAKRKHSDETEESKNPVAVDEVGGVEEEEGKEAATTRTSSRAKKRGRQTPAKKSTRGKKVSTKDEREEEKEPADVLPPSSLDASSSLDKDPSTLSSDGQPEVQKSEVEAASQADVDAASAGQELQPENPENPENQTLEGGVEGGEEEEGGRSRTDIKAVSKQRREPVGPEAKRSRSQSPCVTADVKLPPFKPNNPLGREFVVPGYFCNLCCVFYRSESTAMDVHCSSQRHYDNLQKHHQKLEQKPSRRSTQSSQGSVSD